MKKTDYYEIAIAKLKYRNYSDKTIKAYGFYIKQFFKAVTVAPSRLTSDHFQEYLSNYQFSSISQQNQVINSIKFLYKNAIGKKYGKVDFKRPRGEKKLPRVVDHDVLIQKINHIENIKHCAIIMLAYSVGLRISEVINLQIKDINSDLMQIHIRNAKGRKDRIVPLSENLLKTLRLYYRKHKPKVYLFNGQFGEQYSATSCRNIVKKYIGDIRFHDLRHSFGTYLAEQDVNQRKIADILGHTSTKTSEIYQHISNKSLQSIPLPC